MLPFTALSIPCSFTVLRIAPTAARLTARLLAASFCRPVGSVSLRALSTIVVAPKRAAELRALDALGVVDFVMKELKIDADDCKKLAEQKIDGAALLETSVAELWDRYRLSGGAAHRIMRGIAPAIAEVQAIATEASTVTLKVYPPFKEGGRDNYITMTMTPEDFRIKFVLSSAPLRLVRKDGTVVKEIFTLKEAVDTLRTPNVFLRWTRSFGDDVEDLRGFAENAAEALEQEPTKALANDASLASSFGPLSAVNYAEHFTVSRRGGGRLLQKIEVDGLVAGERAVLFNSTRLTPSLKHVDEVVADAEKLQGMLQEHLESLSTRPPEVKDALGGFARKPVVPFLSGNNFSAAVEAKCAQKGVGIVRPSGEGFVVKAPVRRE